MRAASRRPAPGRGARAASAISASLRLGRGYPIWSVGVGRLLHQLGVEVVALVVVDDEGREVLDLDAPDRLHAELRVLLHLDLLDAVLREARGGAADRAEVEAAVLLAGVGAPARERLPFASITMLPPRLWNRST